MTGIWLSPFYPSPMKDFGYDVADYCDVDPLFGDLKTFDKLIQEAHSRNIKVLIDFVPNHSSDIHPWFMESKSSRDNPKRDWYIWRDAKPDGSTPNNWLSVFGGSAWTWDEHTGQYYLHSFLKEQPDLNWENKEVRNAMQDVLRFWLGRGVDGFRVDAMNYLGKDPLLADDPINELYEKGTNPYGQLTHKYSRNTGNYYDYLRLMAKTCNEYDNRVLVFEAELLERNNPEVLWAFYKELAQPICVPFNFELIFINWAAKDIQLFIDKFQDGLTGAQYPAYVLGNHDQPRIASRVGQANARLGAMLLLTLPGLSFIYNGDELGMENVPIAHESAHDPWEKRVPGLGRDAERSPMQWSAKNYAGFSKTKPWLPIADNFRSVNVAAESDDPDSMLVLYKKLVALRKNSKSLRYGQYIKGPHIDNNVMTFIRSHNDDHCMILLNFSGQPVSLNDLPAGLGMLASTDPNRQNLNNKMLQPFEGLCLEDISP